MIEREQQHADQRLQAIGQSVQQQVGAALLHGDYVKEPVDQFRCIALIEGFQRRLAQTAGNVADQPHEDASLHHFHDVDLEADQNVVEGKAAEQDQHQHHQGLQEHAEGDGVDQRLDGHRGCQGHQARAHREGDHGPDILPFEPHELSQVSARGIG